MSIIIIPPIPTNGWEEGKWRIKRIITQFCFYAFSMKKAKFGPDSKLELARRRMGEWSNGGNGVMAFVGMHGGFAPLRGRGGKGGEWVILVMRIVVG